MHACLRVCGNLRLISLVFVCGRAADSSPPSPVDNNNQEGTLPLPDIRDQLKRKELQEKIAKMEAEQEETKVKIKRSDKDAYNKVS